MAFVTFKNIGIQGLCASVPSNVVRTLEQTVYFDEKKLQNFVSMTGIRERRIAPEGMCASDLCFHAATRLIDGLGIDRMEIEALLFVSQTPDFRQPATSIVLQDRLELSKNVFTLDINQACSGYIWGLSTAYALCNSGLKNVLLLVGDTPSKISSPRDSSTTLMFGDGGTATWIQKDEKFGESYFSLNTDGSACEAVHIPAGGFRQMSSSETLVYQEDEEGNLKTAEQIHMDGMEVFSYSVSALVRDVKKILQFSGRDLESIDTIVLHQANKYMNDLISKKLKINPERSLMSIQKYGNTSSISIPLTLADHQGHLGSNDSLLFTAIGAGFTWGSAIIQLRDFVNLGVLEV